MARRPSLIWVAAFARCFTPSRWPAIARIRGAALLAFAAPRHLGLCRWPGQNGFLTAALIGGRRCCNWRTRPLLAGLLLGLLTYKPHFGLLFPVALIFGGYWRAFFSPPWPPHSRILIVVLALRAGQPYRLRRAYGRHEQRISSPPGPCRLLQATEPLWSAADGGRRRSHRLCGTRAVAPGAGRCSSPGCGGARSTLALKCAALCVATLLATPYLYFYDLPILAIAIAFLWRAHPFGRGEIALLIASQLVHCRPS